MKIDKRKKTLIISILGILLIVFGILISFISYNSNTSLKSVTNYDKLYNKYGDLYQVGDGKDYLLLDKSFKKIDESKYKMVNVYDGYYVKNDGKNYFVMRNGKLLKGFDGNIMGSNELKFYKDDKVKDSKYAYIDAAVLFDGFYKSDYAFDSYCIVAHDDYYIVYDSKTGKTIFETTVVPKVVLLDNKYYGLITTVDSVSKIYTLSSGLKNYIQINGEVFDNEDMKEYNVDSYFKMLNLFDDKYFISKDKNGKYGLTNNKGDVVFDFLYDEVKYSPKSGLVVIRNGVNNSLAKLDGEILYNDYSDISFYDEFTLLYKDNDIIVMRDDKKIDEFNGSLYSYTILKDANGNLMLNYNGGVIIYNSEGKKSDYKGSVGIVDYEINTGFLYNIKDDVFTLYTIDNKMIKSFPFSQMSNYNRGIFIGQSKYNKDYFEIAFLYENENDSKRYLYAVDIKNKTMVENKEVYELQPIGEYYYKVKEDATFRLYDKNLKLLYTKKNISQLIKSDDTHFILIDLDYKVTFIEI